MPESGEGRSARATLAGQVEPVRRWLVGFFRRQSPGEADVDDLVQEVFARIVARDSEEPIDNLNGYVMRTASSVMADNLLRRSTRRASYHVPYDPELHGGDEEFDPERVLSGKEELNAATAALLALPERTRTVFILCRLEGHRQREVAGQLGISVSAVEKHMVKAIQHLAKELETR